MAIEVTGFKVNTVAATVTAGGETATVTLPHTAAGADVVITDVTATGAAGDCTASVPASTKVASGAVTVTVSDGTDSATVTLTITVAPINSLIVKNINMAGWYKVKCINLKEFAYESGGFLAPYKAKAVLAVNGEGGMTGYVTDEQKVVLYAGSSEVSGTVTADVYLMLE